MCHHLHYRGEDEGGMVAAPWTRATGKLARGQLKPSSSSLARLPKAKFWWLLCSPKIAPPACLLHAYHHQVPWLWVLADLPPLPTLGLMNNCNVEQIWALNLELWTRTEICIPKKIIKKKNIKPIPVKIGRTIFDLIKSKNWPKQIQGNHIINDQNHHIHPPWIKKITSIMQMPTYAHIKK